MAGARKPMDVNLASGGKHWTQKEIEDRKSTEAKPKKPKSIPCPKWLSAEAAKIFRAYAKQLLENLPVSNLDSGTLARMCDAEWSYSEASRHKSAFLTIASEIMEAEAADRQLQTIGEDNRNQGHSSDRMETYATCQEQIAYWSKQMAAFEKIARGAANDLGCTISSRCRLVVPKTPAEEDDPLEKLQQSLRVLHG